MVTREQAQGAPQRGRSSRLRRRVTQATLVLSLLGAVVAYFALTPRSQPCWPKPEGYVPPSLLLPSVERRSEPGPDLSAPLTLLLGGDAMVGRGVARSLAQHPRYVPLNGLRAGRAVDLVHFNLESVASAPHPEWPWKAYRFRLPPELLPRALKLMGPDFKTAQLMVSLANNHSLDFGVEGLKETLSALKAARVLSAGAGYSSSEAWAPTVTQVKGQRVGLLSVTDHCGCLDMCGWLATPHRPGVAYAYLSGGEWGPLLEATRRLRAQAEVAIISLHSGPNYVSAVPDWQRELARALVEAGATIVFMHSAHHVLPVERYQGGLIFYALGDLINDYSVNERYRNDLGATALVTLRPNEAPLVHLRPHRLKRRQLLPLSAESPEGQLTLSRLGLKELEAQP